MAVRGVYFVTHKYRMSQPDAGWVCFNINAVNQRWFGVSYGDSFVAIVLTPQLLIVES